MCYPATCDTCGKTTWAGCGKHVPNVYAKVPKDNVCMCKGWPGVTLSKGEESTSSKKKEPAASEDAAPATSETS